MNCKPGDLAIIIAPAPLNPWCAGMIVEVLYRAPQEDFDFPNGVHAKPAGPNEWVIRFAREVPMAWGPKLKKPNIFASCPDSKLRPLPGESEPDAIPAPSKELEFA